jgi:hypothetical protein
MKPQIILPAVGRIVWFRPYNKKSVVLLDAEQPCAAMVAFVWSDRLVNLTVSDHHGATCSRSSVRLVQDGDPIPDGEDYCAWMPYQVEQARKHAAEEQIASEGQLAEPGGQPADAQSAA